MERRVLICDDSELIAIGLEYMVNRIAGLTVVGRASDGADAVRKVRELAPDVVLMDVTMPEMDGIEATRKIKDEFSSVKVLMLSASEDYSCVHRSLSAGADGYCVKTILGDQLEAAIDAVSMGAVWLAPEVSARVRGALSSGKPPCDLKKSASVGVHVDELTARENEILQLMASGLTNVDIAKKLFVSSETVKTHVRHIFEKLAVKHRTQAVTEAIKRGLVAA